MKAIFPFKEFQPLVALFLTNIRVYIIVKKTHKVVEIAEFLWGENEINKQGREKREGKVGEEILFIFIEKNIKRYLKWVSGKYGEQIKRLELKKIAEVV